MGILVNVKKRIIRQNMLITIVTEIAGRVKVPDAYTWYTFANEKIKKTARYKKYAMRTK
jgi:hypothetical protein